MYNKRQLLIAEGRVRPVHDSRGDVSGPYTSGRESAEVSPGEHEITLSRLRPEQGDTGTDIASF